MADTPAGDKKPSMFTPSRIILIVLLLVAVGALLFDLKARADRDNAFEQVDKLLPKDPQDGSLPTADERLATRDEVIELLGEPQAQTNSEMGEEDIYSWDGVFYEYELKLHYYRDSFRRVTSENVFRFGG